MSADMKPCPFCGSKNVSVIYEGSGDYSALCHNGCCGPFARSEIEAVVAWNRRAPAVAAPGDAEDAERYRWLRDGVSNNRMPHVTQYPAQKFDNPRMPQIRDVGMDAAIDAAMARIQSQQGKGAAS